MLNMPHHRLGPITMAGAITMPKSWSLRRTIITTIVFWLADESKNSRELGKSMSSRPRWNQANAVIFLPRVQTSATILQTRTYRRKSLCTCLLKVCLSYC